MARTLVIGDIHGRYEALKQVLKKSDFDYKNDRLIILGDIVDGGYNTDQVVEELIKIDNKIFVLGNHDKWFMDSLSTGWSEAIWLSQGGENTVKSYGAKITKEPRIDGEQYVLDFRGMNVPVTHQEFFNSAKYYHVENDMLFVHGGFDYTRGVEETPQHTLLWDRNMIEDARFQEISGFKKIFVGHTYIGLTPVKRNNVWCVDTGAGWDGKLCLMDVDTEEYWLSDVQEAPTR